MTRRTMALVGLLMATILVLSLTAAATMMIPANDKAKEKAQAPEKSPIIAEGWELERVDFIHYAKPERPAKKPPADRCYKLLGVKWKNLPVDYVINPTNSGLLEGSVTSAIATSAETWDSETSNELFRDDYEINNNVQYGKQDFKNALAFGTYPDNNVIAVTSIWYTPRGRQIVEFDILFNTDYTWGDAGPTNETGLGDTSLMDLQNIATHEFGHGVGLDDIYSTSCTEVTMYGYSEEGETKKRTLEAPDITGLQSLYGT